MLMLDAWFLKIILLGYNFFVAAIIRYAAKVYIINQKSLFDPNLMLLFWIEYSEDDEVLKS